MHVAEQRWRKIKSARRQRDFWLPACRALSNSLRHHPLDTIELHSGHNGTDINGFIEGRPDSQRAHPIANLGDQRLRNAFLHQETRTGTADLSLVEPDAIDEAFDRTVQIGILEDDE